VSKGGQELLNERCKNILDELKSNPSITSTLLEEKLDLSRRQLGYSIDKINDWLMSNNLPVIERTRQGHFVIDQSIFTKLDGNHETIPKDMEPMILNEEQRIQIILIMLLGSEEELSLNHFTYELKISKNTVLNDLKQAQKYLNDFALKIRYTRKYGYLIEGKEFQIRRLLTIVAYRILEMSNGESKLKKLTGIRDELVDDFRKRVENLENQLNLKFTDEKIKIMPYVLILVLRRVEKGYKINSFSIEYEELSNTKEYKATEELLYDRGNIPVFERLYITLYILTANVFSTKATEESIPDLIPAIDNMLRQFEKNACIYLQERDKLMDKIMQHITPAYYRIKFHLTDTILFQGSLSKEFKELHHLVKRSIGPLRELIGIDIPDNEIAYITMLIGGWMNKQGDSIEKKVKAIVVCPQGISVSRLMFNELSELFPEFVFLDYLSVREYMNYPLEYDLIFSPISLETTKKLFVTKAFLGKEEKYRLRKQVMLAVHGYSPNDINVDQLIEVIKDYATVHDERALIKQLVGYFDKGEDTDYIKQGVSEEDINLDELIKPENITLLDSIDSWEDAVRISAAPLIDRGNIEPKYVDAMIRYCEKDPYIVIGPNVAIPHAAPEDGVNKVGMSLLKLKDGVQYTNDYKINVIVSIAALDKKQHIHALMQLMSLVGSEEDRNQVIIADSKEKVYEIIKSYSKD